MRYSFVEVRDHRPGATRPATVTIIPDPPAAPPPRTVRARTTDHYRDWRTRDEEVVKTPLATYSREYHTVEADDAGWTVYRKSPQLDTGRTWNGEGGSQGGSQAFDPTMRGEDARPSPRELAARRRSTDAESMILRSMNRVNRAFWAKRS
jgi:hypothetical protein